MTTPIGSSLTSSTATDTSTTQNANGKAGGSLDRDAFLKLLVAQLSHQDPLKPMEGTEFVSQLAQYSQVEQALAQTQKLELLSTQISGLSNNEAAALAGRSVTVRGNGIAFDGTTATSSSVTLGGPAQQVTATIRDANGAVVRTMELGARSGGAVPVTWDGRDAHGQTVARGSYTLQVSATRADGAAVRVSQDVTGVVTRVSFDKGYPELVLDNGSTAPISDLVSVGQTSAGTTSSSR